MQKIKLSDQLGAMAIIDELYQKKQLLLEHLDRNTLHSNLKESIKNYYLAKGLQIDEKTIEEGIHVWFDNRLRFNKPNRSCLQCFLVFLYIKRNVLFSIIGILLLLLTLIITSQLVSTKILKNDIYVTYNHILVSNKSLIDLNNKFIEVSKSPIIYAQVPANKLKVSIANLLNQEIIPIVLKPNYDLSFIKSKGKDYLKKLQQIDVSLNKKISEINSQIIQLNKLLKDDQQLEKIINNEEFIEASKQYPILQTNLDTIRDHLNKGDFIIDLNSIELLYNSIERAKVLEKKMQTDIKQLQTLNVPKSDMEPIIALQTTLNADLKNLNFDNVDHYHEMITYYIKLAQTPLIMTIVDNPKNKSGVERTHDKTGGKSWYLIVEPRSPTGTPFSLWVKSIETGETKLVSIFGQQVTQKAFNQVKADKVKDGHIDNNQLCNKPVGRIDFNCPKTVKTGRILEW